MMHSHTWYLRPDIQIEPLVDQWYAWGHLIPPATMARNMTQRHFRIMDSYLSAPDVHETAARNPKMLGGPFIDHSGRVEEVRELRERTARERAALVELSAALEEVDRMLRTVTDGQPLSPLYARLPPALRGYVELAYDIHDAASFRLIEPLLYRSRYFDRRAQSLLLSVTKGDDRSFVLSTPRLESPDTVHFHWSFDDERVDQLFRLKREPQSWEWIRDSFGLGARDAEVFQTFLVDHPPAPYQPYDGTGIRWRYFGHACILIETRFQTILLDPGISYSYASTIPRYTYADLPDRIDHVLITHNHMDHVLLETLLQIRQNVGEIIVPRGSHGALQDPSLKLLLENVGFERVRELGELETIDCAGGSITGLPFLGEHADLAIATKLVYLVRLGRQQLLFAADCCTPDPYLVEHVHDAVGDSGALFIGMECEGAPLSWLYGPLLLRPIDRNVDRARRLAGADSEQVRSLIERFRCENVYVYAMGQEPWLNHVMSLKYTEQSRPITESNAVLAYCHSRGINAERLFGEREILVDRVYDDPALLAM